MCCPVRLVRLVASCILAIASAGSSSQAADAAILSYDQTARQAEAKENDNRWAEAATLWRTLLDSLPAQPPEATARREETLARLADAERRANRNRETVEALEEAIALRTARLGESAPQLGRLLSDLAGAKLNVPGAKDISASADRAVKLTEGAGEAFVDDLVYALLIRSRFRDFRGAREDLDRAIPLARAHLPKTRPTLGRLLSDLGWLAVRDNRPLEALAPLEEAEQLNRAERHLHPFILNRLGVLHGLLGNPKRAEECIRGYITGLETILGPSHFQVAEGWDNLAWLLLKQARFGEATETEQRALRIFTATFGERDSRTGLSHLRLGHIFSHIGDRAGARHHYEIAAATLEAVATASHLDVSLAWMQLARMGMEDGRDVRPLAERAYARLHRLLGPEHFNTLDAAELLRRVELAEGRLEDSFRRAEEILAARQKSFGPENPGVAGAWGAVGEACGALERWPEAETAYRAALRLAGPDGLETPAAIEHAQALATVLLRTGRRDEALSLAREAETRGLRLLSRTLAFTSESQRLAAVERLRPFDLFAELSSAADLAQAVLRRKGLVLESMIEDELLARASADAAVRTLLERQRALTWALEQPGAAASATTDRNRRYAEKQMEMDDLQSALARAVAGVSRGRRAVEVKTAEVRRRLPADTVLVEFVRYGKRLPRSLKTEPHYGAVVLRAGEEPRWHPLGRSAPIDEGIGRVLSLAEEGNDPSPLRELAGSLASPWLDALPAGIRRVVISPEGNLSFVPWAGLIDSRGRFLAERCQFATVGSGRDLLRDAATGDARLVAFAAPAFGDKIEGATAGNLPPVGAPTYRSRRLVPLPGALSEAESLRTRARSGGLEPVIFTGAAASEQRLLEAGSPRILHLATHGIFLPLPVTAGSDRVRTFLGNAMDRSILALSGAAETLRDWDEGKYPPSSTDGILTAREIGTLQLSRTELVVLSACDSGRGEAHGSEGVLGLRRGFQRAGVRNLLTSLWQVEDAAAAGFMADFYAEMFRPRPAPLALAEVQRRWLERVRAQHGAVVAFRRAAGYAIALQGPLDELSSK